MGAAKGIRSKSIIRAAILVFSMTMLLPALAVMAFEFYVSSYYRGESNILTRLFDPEPSMVRLNRESDAIARRINMALVEDPEKLEDPAFLGGLVSKSALLAIVLRMEDGTVFFFGPRVRMPKGLLPNYGEMIDPGLPLPDPERHIPFVLDQIDFRTRGGDRASIFVLGSPESEKKRRPFGFSRTLVFIFAAALLALNGAAGLLFMRRLLKPLGSLERAAESLGAGKFDAPVISPGVRELDSVFRAFETMRIRLDGLIGRVRAEERSRRELIANLSHDVRTPLTTVRGYVDGLKDGIADTPEKRGRYLAVLDEQAKRLERMMEDIFLLATLQSRESDDLTRPLALGPFLENGVEELSIVYADKAAISVERDVSTGDDDGYIVEGDPFRLKRLMENLVRNSVEHGGKDHVAIAVRLSRDGAFAVVTVEDDGKGFPPGTLDRAFDRSWRGDEARCAEGSGLGLAIAREIVLAHGGSIEARNGSGADPWPGAALRFTLPVASSRASADPPGSATP